ncbi:unnamed protein product [Rotaria sp. Silwood2]|nr:unnamed protein product [Rotaria sp. Silwood2]CAF4049822.1 unnamed protein product [Rotaria sp. Silwood2]
MDYITEFETNKFFLILSAHVGEQIIPLIDQCCQIESIYIYLGSEMKSVPETEFYGKVSGIFVDIDSICEQLNIDARRCSNNLLSMSSIPFPFTRKHRINGKDVSFMYSQLVRDLFLNMDLEIPSVRDMIFHFSIKFEGNKCGLALIDELDRDYCSMQSNIRSETVSKNRSIWWYTRCDFVYEVINQALRMQDIDMLYKMRYFIVDIHRQLKELYVAQSKTKIPLTVYRGQAMLNEEFEQHKSNINGLLTINNFLSTSTDYLIAKLFASTNKNRPGMQAVLFEIELDSNIHCQDCPYASIEQISYFQTECEVLMSMGSIFRIISMDKDNDDIWKIRLKLINKQEDHELETMADNIWEKIRSSDDLFSLIKLLRLMGDFENAKVYIDQLLNESSFWDDIQNLALLVNEVGLICEEEGDFATASVYYQIFMDMKQKRQLICRRDTILSTLERATFQTISKYIQDMNNENNEKLIELKNSLKNEEKSSVLNEKKLASYCQLIGHIYELQENDEEALNMYQKSLKLFVPVSSTAMQIYSSMALLYAKQNDWSTSNTYIEKTLKYLDCKSDIDACAQSYEKIGLAYEVQGRYADAVRIYEKILSFVPDDDNYDEIVLANIGYIYDKQQNYIDSLKIYERLLSLQLDMLYRNHHRLADTYALIANSLYGQQKYQEAYTNLTNALNIDFISLSANNPWVKKRQGEIDFIRQKIYEA